MYKNVVKPILDFLGALLLAPFVCIEIAILAPVIYFTDRGPVFYMGKRRGKNGKIFSMFKLRSMKVNAPDLRNEDNSTYNSAKDPRVTKIGRIMRKTSLDELPQVFNILKGDMSFIGPRAPVPKEGVTWDDLDADQKKRLEVRPGITGYAAAKFRNSIDHNEKIRQDCYYADHVSFKLDVKIIWWTLKTVLLRKNVYKNED